MDPITTAIVAALTALASDLVKSAVNDTYAALKAVIQRKWGEGSPVSKAVDALEVAPKSKGPAAALAEQLAVVNAIGDPEILQALAKLVDALKNEGIGGEAVAQIAVNITAGNVQGVVGAQTVSIGSMTFETPSIVKKR
jgi:hypothetical protein